MPEHVFVGGPLHGKRLPVPSDRRDYMHLEPVRTTDAASSSLPSSSGPLVAFQTMLYYRHAYVVDGQRGIAFSLPASTDADLLDAIAANAKTAVAIPPRPTQYGLSLVRRAMDRMPTEFTMSADELRAAGPGFEVRLPGMELD